MHDCSVSLQSKKIEKLNKDNFYFLLALLVAFFLSCSSEFIYRLWSDQSTHRIITRKMAEVANVVRLR